MNKLHKFVRVFGKVTAVSLMGVGSSYGEDVDSPDAFRELCDEAWGAMTFYENEENPVIQKFAFTGRFQADYIHVEGDGVVPGTTFEQSLHDDDYNTRRLRVGGKATIFHDFTLHVEADLKPDEAPVYNRLTDAYIGWKHSDALQVKVGKQSMGFTLDGATSSKKFLTIDRSNVANNLWFSSEYAPGVSVSGQYGNWNYKAGVFSQGEADKEFGNFDGGVAVLTSLGYDFADSLGADEALLTLDYVYNEETPASPTLFTNRSLGHVGSLNFRYAQEDYGFRTEIAYGDGFLGQPDLWGFQFMPYYNFTSRLQGVLRYTYVESDGDNGVRFTGYESAVVVSAKGDEYQEVYAGLNYYIYGHKLKVQTGLAYMEMRDSANDGGEFDGISWITGLRLSW